MAPAAGWRTGLLTHPVITHSRYDDSGRAEGRDRRSLPMQRTEHLLEAVQPSAACPHRMSRQQDARTVPCSVPTLPCTLRLAM